MDLISIIDYLPEHQPYFESLNKHWIEKYFEIESLDKFILTQPEDAIYKHEGTILMALYNNTIAGTVALIKVDDTTFELAKMAVGEPFQKKGIAKALCHAIIEKAKEFDAKQIVLYTNKILKPAICLYEKIGFKHVPGNNNTEYSRANIKMLFKLS